MRYGEYSLGDLLSDHSLGLELLTGGADAYSVPLLGAHAIELENPAKWLDSGWMMLTMGVRLRNKPELQRQLIAELQELGASCLGLGVGLSFKSAPPALIDEANRRNFPIVLVPEETQFRDVTRAVFHSTVGIESTTFQRLSSIQQNLIRAFADDSPLESIVKRLARLIHSTVAVVSVDGQVDITTGSLPLEQIAEELAKSPNFSLVQFDAADQHVLAAPVTAVHGPSARWLVVSAAHRAAHDLHVAAVQVSAPLIDAILRLNVTSVGQDRALREVLLDAVLDGSPDADTRDLAARLSALNIDLRAGVRAAVVRERPAAFGRREQPVDLGEVSAAVHRYLESCGARYLLSRRSDEIVVVTADGTFSDGTEELVATWPTLTVGIGRQIHYVADIRASYRDAQIAVQHLKMQPDRAVLAFGELDVVTQLLAEVPAERFAATAAPIVALLTENPNQLEALRAFFAANRDTKAAADSIFLHPNTLRYRLERLEHALGRSLREPAVTASLYCVLTLLEDLRPTSHDPSAAGSMAAGDQPPADHAMG
jgi:DNA-binding PucR family transcriptional regulator